jgi:hypothetical protein
MKRMAAFILSRATGMDLAKLNAVADATRYNSVYSALACGMCLAVADQIGSTWTADAILLAAFVVLGYVAHITHVAANSLYTDELFRQKPYLGN